MDRNRIIRALRQELYRELNSRDPRNLRELRNHHQELRQKYFELCFQFEDMFALLQQDGAGSRDRLVPVLRFPKK